MTVKVSIKVNIQIGLLILVLGAQASAQDVQPMVYRPAPVGANLLTLGYSYSAGAVLFDKTIPIEDADADIHTVAAAYSRSIGIFGLAGRFDLAVPFVVGDWMGDVYRETETTSRTGFGDPTLRLAVFVFGAPALRRKEFAAFHPKTIVGVTLRVGVPLGQYDAERLVNLGSNRWVFSPQLSLSHITGPVIFEGYAGVWLFTNNNAFLGDGTFSQDPLFSFQAHVGYLIRPRFWIAVSSRQSLGGAPILGSGDRLTSEANNRIGLTLSFPVGPRVAVRFAATTGITATIGNDYTTVGAGFQVAP